MTNRMFPNTFHSDCWSLSFSNVPTIESYKDMKYLENYVRTFSIPDYSMEIFRSNFKGKQIIHPAEPKTNSDLNNINISFRLSEDFQNYLYMFQWIYNLKHGEDIDTEYFKDYLVKSININILDNEKRTIAILYFQDAFLTDLGNINLTMGSSDEIDFNTTWAYQKVKYEVVNVGQ